MINFYQPLSVYQAICTIKGLSLRLCISPVTK